MELITTNEALSELCAELANQRYITIDTEFLREKTFWPQVCLIQTAGQDIEAMIDPLAEGIDLAPFYALLANENVLKVMLAVAKILKFSSIRRRPFRNRFLTRKLPPWCAALVMLSVMKRSFVKPPAAKLTRQPLYRLEPASAERQSTDLCAGRRHPFARCF